MSGITLSRVTKNFGGFTAVRGIDLAVRDAEFVAILGPSGCGKTTTMNMIAGIEQVSSGTIHFDRRDVTRVPLPVTVWVGCRAVQSQCRASPPHCMPQAAAAGAAARARYSPPLASNAQTIRAVMLACATEASRTGRRSSTPRNQAVSSVILVRA